MAQHEWSAGRAGMAQATLGAMNQLVGEAAVARALDSTAIAHLLRHLLSSLLHPRFAASGGGAGGGDADDTGNQVKHIGRWMSKMARTCAQ